MLIDYLILALKNIRKRGLRSWLTMLGIFFGIAAVIALISLGQGLQQAITGQFATLDVDKLVIQNIGTGFGPPGSTVVKKLTKNDLKIIESVSGVDVAIPRLIRVVKVEFNKIINFRYITSLPDNKEQIKVIYDALNVELKEGQPLTETDQGKVILGNDFTDDSFEKRIRVGSVLEIQGKNFEVIGILKKASTFQINSVILMPESDLKEILNIGDEIDLIVAQVSEQKKIQLVSKNIERELRRDRDLNVGEEDFSVETPLQSIETINTILSTIQLVLTGIAAISLLIGGIGIANTMFTSVLERTKEIGVMKAIGAKNSDILTIFLIEAGILGLIGGALGIVIGVAVSKIMEYIAINQLGTTLLQAATPLYLIFGCLAFSFFIGAISGLLPAYQALKVKPVEALRYE